jgi:type IV pilus biogenesis protein CpaD/CtpE
MTGGIMQRSGRDGGLMASLAGALLLSLGGCASEPPKPAPTVTPDQVRSHADKAFEKLKQEEQNRAVDPAMTP